MVENSGGRGSVGVTISSLPIATLRDRGRQARADLAADEPTPVVITYNFMFGIQKPAPGTTCVLLAEVWFEDAENGLAVDGYTFDAPLTVGGARRPRGP